ncbi:hypothetical protein CYLTODRAFT_417715 [Cylindrobasidium torrendii FP15055 ss-10]|uniref:Uncharacterized protein n=1 Tax=Cylindrobasidium torrendii FP15055 ss-10 TaxID=1314674 RepID=A0A0D7BQB3_9AGAR|nr:hypothetical protein CYLTODRAFT_417715 [Cylindrobasidium torrendii FP15055 ss-10]
MPPSEYSLRLQKGITGGFAPPTPNAIFTVTRPLNSAQLNVTSATRETGTRGLQDAVPKSIPHPEELMDELHTILKQIPTEQPPGSEDIYGLDTSIAYGADDFMWCNGGPQGCGGGKSEVQATEEDKAKFKRAVEIVHKLVEEH